MVTVIETETGELQELINKAVSPLLREIENLRGMLRPQAANFDDYEKGYEVAIEVTGKAKSTIARLVKENEIPSIKKGGNRYFSRTELRLWLAEGRRKILTEMV